MHKLRSECYICRKPFEGLVGDHMRSQHGEEEFKRAILKAKERGISDQEIGAEFGITFRQLEEIITQTYGINISVIKKPKRIKYWEPKDFKEETTTVWSYKKRGDWATHDGRYRGNWSPYIPRNVILKYSRPLDTVLDFFVGGGTTAVEAKLLGRKCIAMDINPACIALTLENLKFMPPQTPFPIYEPNVSVGDARFLSNIADNSIDLICAHPPYAGIINYSSHIDGDLSKLSIENFLNEMKKVAIESYRVLKAGKKCAILIGDTRKHKYVIPIGFQTINVFLEAGFKLKELVIKRQHNCKTTGFWYEKSTKYNFLLLAHEYLPIFEKPEEATSHLIRDDTSGYGSVVPVLEKLFLKKINELETTTVWIFPEKEFEERLNKNVIDRYAYGNEYSSIVFTTHFKKETIFHLNNRKKRLGLLFIKSPFLKEKTSCSNIEHYLKEIREKIVKRNLLNITKGGFLVIQTQDTITDGYIQPLAKKIIDTLSFDNLWLKEIVVATQEGANSNTQNLGEHLKIVHQYLLVYEVKT